MKRLALKMSFVIFISYLLTGCVTTVNTPSTGEKRNFYPWSKPTYEEWRDAEIAKNQKKETKRKKSIAHRKKDIRPLNISKDYTCTVYPSMVADSRKVLDITFGTYTIEITEYPFGRNDGTETNLLDKLVGDGVTTVLHIKDKYNKYISYSGYPANGNKKMEAKVYTKKGINNGNINFEINTYEKYYCIESK